MKILFFQKKKLLFLNFILLFLSRFFSTFFLLWVPQKKLRKESGCFFLLLIAQHVCGTAVHCG